MFASAAQGGHNNVSNQKSLTMPPQLNTCTSALLGKTEEHGSCIFTQMPEFNQSLLDFFNLFDSRLIFTLLCDSVNLVINAFSPELLGAHGS